MIFPRWHRRQFLSGTGLLAAAGWTGAKAQTADEKMAIPDEGWRLWLDEATPWHEDTLYLPGDVSLEAIPARPPTGGWDRLSGEAGIAVALPATVEQFYWGRSGLRPYTIKEYAWAQRDPVPQNGAYRGVSWWWRDIQIPASFAGRRILLHVRGARLRAEVYLNRQLVGYSILEELPFVCDLSKAARPGGANQLAIRITNPGGHYDWVDGDTLAWGKVKLQASHGFGGLDRALSLSAHPMRGHIEDVWILNRPEPRTADAFVRLSGSVDASSLSLSLEESAGRAVVAEIKMLASQRDRVLRFRLRAPAAKIWDLETPHLYRITARYRLDGGESVASRLFGFRWFAPQGVGHDALFRLNGRRVRLYSAISWGYWALNGLWPTLDLAEKEATQAKALGLNCLNFHRNVGKEDVFDTHDRLGVLRYMEPGGGKLAVGRWPDNVKADANSIVMEKPATEADLFAQRHMREKCLAMVRAFRSHPSLIQYTLQNEMGADFHDPATLAILNAMRAEDESRIIALNDGLIDPPTRAAQAWYEPYNSMLHRSDREAWGAWWDEHQGAGDQWYDGFYKGPADFIDHQPLRESIVEFGEMEACAVPDNQVLGIADILQRGGKSYDLDDRHQILAAYEGFLDRWKFRSAFPKTEDLFQALGRKSYEAWQEYLENVRINDATDFAAISGWESTAIENHAGLVDNLRNFKSDPEIIRTSLLPVRPLAKQHALVVARGTPALFDLWLLNDTGKPVTGPLDFIVTEPSGQRRKLGSFPAPGMRPDQFSALLKERLASPPLEQEGLYRFIFSLSGRPRADHVREILVVDPLLRPDPAKTLRVGVSGILPGLAVQLAAIPGITVEPYKPGIPYDAVIAGGLHDGSTPAQRLGGDAGVQMQRETNSPLVPGQFPPGLLSDVGNGIPLLVVAQEDGLADGLATALAGEGAFVYRGQVGRLRAPWMGSWYFLRKHPVYQGLPVNRAMGVEYQAHGRQANGLIVEGPGVDVFVGYSRDHDRQVGAGTFTTRVGSGKILFQRVPDLNGPMQQRFLRNALAWLCSS